ncbi:multidrug MFS transporter [Streptococcus suis]|nr:multidrug MFS transporter [Streptococcus suis]
MIFVTVGTHEQPFNRLIEEVDCLKREGIITDDVFIQTGFSTYEPQCCEWKSIISYSEMESYMDEANIIISHGGPATFMGAIARGKKPIVVPRRVKFGEHVNDHQMEFAEAVKNQLGTIFTVIDINKLETLIKLPLSDFVADSSTSNNSHFVDSFVREVTQLLNGAK